MRARTVSILLAPLVVVLVASPLWAGSWNGSVKLGGIILDEEGDLSTVQETYNIHDGFSLTQLRLTGNPSGRNYLMIDLREINLDARQGDFLFRKPGAFKLTGSFDQHRQVFDPDRATTSERKDWRFGVQVRPAKWLAFSGDLGVLMRDGDRLGFPLPSGQIESALGTGYDNRLTTGRVGFEARKGARGLAVDFRHSDFKDELNGAADRTGKVVSARFNTPCAFYKKWTHLLRGAYGVSELSDAGTEYTLSNFQYTGVVRPVKRFQFRYAFNAQRVDNESTRLKTDRFQNDFDATFYHKHGSLTGGYGYEINDDDRSLTSYNSFRAGLTLRHGKVAKVKVRYADRVKKDTEELTLLKDVEASRFRADLGVRPVEGLDLGVGFNVREREYPDIGVESEGETFRTHGRYSLDGWGAVSATYSLTDDEYTDLAGKFDAETHLVTARVDLERIPKLHLASGVTYVESRKDLDIEKSILFFEAAFDVIEDWSLEAKYNVYNYDDFILLDRYYTANVVWINVAYDLHIE